MSAPNPGGNARPNTVIIDSDDSDIYELDSDSEDGGMQLDPPDPTLQLQIANREMELEMAQENYRIPQRQGKPSTPPAMPSKHKHQYPAGIEASN